MVRPAQRRRPDGESRVQRVSWRAPVRTSVKPPEVRGDLRLLGVRTRHVTSSPRSSACADKERGRSGVGRLATCSRALGGHSGHLEDRLRAGAAGRAEHGDRALRSKRHPTLAQRGRRADAQRRSHREGARQEAEELHRSGEAISWQKRVNARTRCVAFFFPQCHSSRRQTAT